MGSNPLLLIIGFPSAINMYTNDKKKPSTDSLALKKPTYYHKNEWQHKHGQYNSRVNYY
jgi:hypothetical protein